MLDEERYKAIREELQGNPSSAEGLMVLSRLAKTVGNWELEWEAKVKEEERLRVTPVGKRQ